MVLKTHGEIILINNQTEVERKNEKKWKEKVRERRQKERKKD